MIVKKITNSMTYSNVIQFMSIFELYLHSPTKVVVSDRYEKKLAVKVFSRMIKELAETTVNSIADMTNDIDISFEIDTSFKGRRYTIRNKLKFIDSLGDNSDGRDRYRYNG